MNSRKPIFVLIGLAVLAGAPLLAQAQVVGARVGIAPPVVNPPIVVPGFSQPMVVGGFPGVGIPGVVHGFAFGPTISPSIVTRPGFVVSPFHVPGPIVVPGGVFPGVVVPGGTFPGVVVPGGFVPGGVFPGGFVPGGIVPGGFVPGVVPGIIVVPHPRHGRFVTPPPVGMSRADLLRQFGTPVSTVVTRDGETLSFRGGLSVVLENGRVAGSR